MSDVKELRSTSTEGLLTAYAALTHRMHVAEVSLHRGRTMREQYESLRAQRDLIRDEILRRTL